MKNRRSSHIKLLTEIARNLIIRELIGRMSIYPFEQFSMSQLVNEVKPRPPTLIMIENYDHNVPQLTSSIFAFSVSMDSCLMELRAVGCKALWLRADVINSLKDFIYSVCLTMGSSTKYYLSLLISASRKQK